MKFCLPTRAKCTTLVGGVRTMHKCRSIHCIADECLVCNNDAAQPCWHSFHFGLSARWIDLCIGRPRVCQSAQVSVLSWHRMVNLCWRTQHLGMSFWIVILKWGMCDAGPVALCDVLSVFSRWWPSKEISACTSLMPSQFFREFQECLVVLASTGVTSMRAMWKGTLRFR